MSTRYNPSIVRDNIVQYLDAANTKSYPGSGTTWIDMSSRNRDGTLTNGPTFSTDNLGCFNFDGSNDYVDLNFVFTQASSANSYTVVVAAKLSSTSNSRRQIFACDNGGFDWGFGSGDNGNFIIFTGSGAAQGRTQDLNWHIFTAQWSSSFGTRLWIDDVLDISTSTISYDNGVASTTNLARNPGFGEIFHGKIALCLTYDKALTEPEIKQNFNALRGRFGL